jgi:DNA-directed RNA polymerase subunit alpha
MKTIERPNIKIIEEKPIEDGPGLYGRYMIQPLIRGFGTTLGNSLRRILISSITGSAVVYMKMDGVLHEFTAVEGMVEDVADVVLNLKGLPVSVDTDELVPLKLEIKGPKKVTAGDIEADDRVDITEPDYHICTITSQKTVKIEIGVQRGRGYVPTEWHVEDPDIPKDRGIIHIDSNFSPIVRSRFAVEPARVGQRSDYDRLIIEIETDGTVSPADALSEAARILIKEFSFIVDFKERILLEEEKKEEEEKRKSQDLKKTIDELDLSVRSYNCLKNASIFTVEELITWSETRLRGLRNFGEKSLKEIKAKLGTMGLELMQDEII